MFVRGAHYFTTFPLVINSCARLSTELAIRYLYMYNVYRQLKWQISITIANESWAVLLFLWCLPMTDRQPQYTKREPKFHKTLDWSCTHRRCERCKKHKPKTNVVHSRHIVANNFIFMFSALPSTTSSHPVDTMCISISARPQHCFSFFLFRWDTLNYLILM